MDNRHAPTKPGQLWGGRFKQPADTALTTISRSPPRYFSLTPYDIDGSRAHAAALYEADIITAEELETLTAALVAMRDDFLAHRLTEHDSDEDVHGFIERVLIERIGALGGKLRAGRSRNDQTVNDLRLYLRDKARCIVKAICNLQEAIQNKAAANLETIAPGFTHLQPAQPIVFAHQLLAHAQSFNRDMERMQDWDRRAATSSLGAAALAGSAITLNPEAMADALSYERSFENSIDIVSSRDHIAEFMFVCAMHAVNLSRLAEEICLWCSYQFKWIELDDAFATGSSIMPQKKNPDIAELTRGKSGRLIGDMAGLMATLKSLPMAYNRDLTEDKMAAFEAVDVLEMVLPAMTGVINSMKINVETLRSQATSGFTLATDIADHLAKNGVPFNEAHEITGELVRMCESRNIKLNELSGEDLDHVDKRLGDSLAQLLTLESSVNRRSGKGGTSPARVNEQLGSLRIRTDEHQAWADSYEGPQYPV